MDTILCLLDGARGIYVPKAFVDCYDADKWHVNSEDVVILEDGPENKLYWDAWDDVIDYAFFIDDDGVIWHLYQDDDLFAVAENHVWEDE